MKEDWPHDRFFEAEKAFLSFMGLFCYIRVCLRFLNNNLEGRKRKRKEIKEDPSLCIQTWI